MAKRSERKKLVDKLDKIFQLYVRIRDNWKCITCGICIYDDTFSMHAGHYIDRGNHQVRWDEFNVNAQCKSCNAKEHWTKNKAPYAQAFIEKYGLEEHENLIHRSRSDKKFMRSDLEEMLQLYQSKIEQLKEFREIKKAPQLEEPY